MLGWRALRAATEIHEAAMEYRKALENRCRNPHLVDRLDGLAPSFHAHELAAARTAYLTYRRVVPAPIREWQRNTVGLGEPGMARLLGHLGHPAWRWVYRWDDTRGEHVLIDSGPRSFGQLVAYAGLVPGRAKRKGMTAEDAMALGNQRVGPVLHSIAESAGVKNTASIYRVVYDDARAVYDATDVKPIVSHMRALRLVKREILRDLWLVACSTLDGERMTR